MFSFFIFAAWRARNIIYKKKSQDFHTVILTFLVIETFLFTERKCVVM